MRKLFLWLEVVCLAYVLLGILNPLALPGSPVTPLWLWGAVLGLACLVNAILSRKPRTMLSIIVINSLCLGVGGIMPLLVYQHLLLGNPVYNLIPTFIEIVFIWPILIYLMFNDNDKNLRLALLETGIGLLMLGLLLSKKFQPLMYQPTATAVFLLSGLLNEAIATAGLNHKFTVRDLLTTVLIGPVLLAGALSIGWIFGSPKVGSLISGLFTFAVDLLRKIGHWLDVTGLNKPVSKVNITKVQGNFQEAGSFNSAPLWVMIILWTILAVLSAVLIIEVIRNLVPWIKELLAALRSLKIGQDDRGDRDLTRGDWYAWIILTSHTLKRLLIQWIGNRRVMKPHNLISLYAFFLKWGSKNKLARLTGETPSDYLLRLRLALADHPNILQNIEIATMAYNHHRYGGFSENISKTEIEQMAKELRQARIGVSFLRRVKEICYRWRLK